MIQTCLARYDFVDMRLEAISTELLTPLARKSMEDSSVELRSWVREPVHGGFGGAIGGTAIFRFKGQTTRHQPWSVILKVLYQRPQETQTSPYYWKREYEVYRSGMLDDLPHNTFARPLIYGLTDFGDACWIWMEDIAELKPDWSLSDYHNIALHLGRLNGAYLMGHPLPDYDWLTHGWHCAIVPPLADAFDKLDVLLEHPLARRSLPIDAKADIESIWNSRERYRRALANLPQTLCHIDAFRRNLLHRKDDVVLLDWAAAGHAGLGEELVALVAVSLYYNSFSHSYAEQLDAAVFAGYVKGLREIGWSGDAKQARIGYTCAMVLRGLAGVKQDIDLLMNEDRHEELKRNHHSHNMNDIADFFAEVRRFRLLRMAKEAQDLLAA